jgi:hypothetical protein
LLWNAGKRSQEREGKKLSLAAITAEQVNYENHWLLLLFDILC